MFVIDGLCTNQSMIYELNTFPFEWNQTDEWEQQGQQ